MEKLDYLIDYLLKENKDIKIEKMPYDQNDKKRLYRSLCNIREAKLISDEYIKIENEYLQEELKKKNIVNVDDIKPINDRNECLFKGDITTLRIDAIVNAANSQGLGCFIPCHNCIDNQIGSNAGVCLRLECNEIMKKLNYNLPTGNAIITKAYNLPSKYIIHTVGPIIYNEVTKKDEDMLADCYKNSLEIALQNNIKSIAFPCISTGVFKFPKEKASKIAIKAVDEFIRQRNKDVKVVFCVFSQEDEEIYERKFKQN